MQLLLAIVHDEDADPLGKRLNALGFRITRLNTVGGFLSAPNATVLIGVSDEEIEQVLAVIRATCRTRHAIISPMPWAVEPGQAPFAAPGAPLEAEVGGATIFCLPVAQFHQLPGASPSTPASAPQPGGSQMKLVLAIVHSDDATPIANALLAANHRLTRINTAGGFLRRGNVTLLIGVEADKTEEVLQILSTHARARAETTDQSASRGATVFVLETSRFLQI